MPDTTTGGGLAIQTQCVHCWADHATMAVKPISEGGCTCAHCGMASTRLTEDEYRMLLRVQQEGE